MGAKNPGLHVKLLKYALLSSTLSVSLLHLFGDSEIHLQSFNGISLFEKNHKIFKELADILQRS